MKITFEADGLSPDEGAQLHDELCRLLKMPPGVAMARIGEADAIHFYIHHVACPGEPFEVTTSVQFESSDAERRRRRGCPVIPKGTSGMCSYGDCCCDPYCESSWESPCAMRSVTHSHGHSKSTGTSR